MTVTLGKPRARSRATAKAAGSTLERVVADALANLWQTHIDRKVKTGSKDQGDIGGMTVGGNPVVIECKNVRTLNLTGWWGEALAEKVNVATALIAKGRAPEYVHAIVVFKRHGKAAGEEQWALMPVGELVRLLEAAGGQR